MSTTKGTDGRKHGNRIQLVNLSSDEWSSGRRRPSTKTWLKNFPYLDFVVGGSGLRVQEFLTRGGTLNTPECVHNAIINSAPLQALCGVISRELMSRTFYVRMLVHADLCERLKRACPRVPLAES